MVMTWSQFMRLCHQRRGLPREVLDDLTPPDVATLARALAHVAALEGRHDPDCGRSALMRDERCRLCRALLEATALLRRTEMEGKRMDYQSIP